MPADRVYEPADRPDIEVLVPDDHGGTWHPGELRAWQARGEEQWANVAYTTAPGSTHLATVPAEQVRPC